MTGSIRAVPTPRSVRLLGWLVLALAIFLLALAAVSPPRAALAAVTPSGAATAQDDVIAFLDVTVLPMDRERRLERHTVIVRDGRIVAVGPQRTTRVPRGATRIEGRGRFLMPGFTEMHAHVPGGDPDDRVIEDLLFLFVANGVTTMRGMQGNPSHLELRHRIARDEVIAPTFYAAGPGFGGAAMTIEQARARVEEQHAAGYDLLKIAEGMRPEVYRAMAETAKRLGVPFAGHVPNDVGLFAALDAGQRSIDHMDNFIDELIPDDAPIRTPAGLTQAGRVALHADPARIPALAARVRDSGAWIVPTVALWEVFNDTRTADELTAAMPEVRYIPPAMLELWQQRKTGMLGNLDPEAGRRTIELRRRMLGALGDAGARIAFGTDAPQIFSVPGFSIHREIAVMQAAGLTPWQILESGTRIVAEYFEATDEFGTVAVGRRADLILLDADPLDDPAHLARRAGVMLRGRWLPEAEIQRRLDEIAGRYVAEE